MLVVGWAALQTTPHSLPIPVTILPALPPQKLAYPRPGELLVEEGEQFRGWDQLHSLEGALRASARKAGHLLHRRVMPPAWVNFVCAEVVTGCPFMVLLAIQNRREKVWREDDDAQLNCRVHFVENAHTCERGGVPCSRKIRSILRAWVSRVASR